MILITITLILIICCVYKHIVSSNIIEKLSNPKKKINLYQVYHDKHLIPRKVYNNIKTYASNYNHVIYDFDECKSFIEQYYGNKGVDIWNSLKTPAHKVDFWRYCILYNYGGVYLDIKIELFNDIVRFVINK